MAVLDILRREKILLNFWKNDALQDMMKRVLEEIGAEVACLRANEVPSHWDKRNIRVVFFDFTQEGSLDFVQEALGRKLFILNLNCPQAITVAAVDAGRMVGNRSIVEVSAEPIQSSPEHYHQVDVVMAVSKNPDEGEIMRLIEELVTRLVAEKQTEDAEIMETIFAAGLKIGLVAEWLRRIRESS